MEAHDLGVLFCSKIVREYYRPLIGQANVTKMEETFLPVTYHLLLMLTVFPFLFATQSCISSLGQI